MPRESLHFLVTRKLLKIFPNLDNKDELVFVGSFVHDSPYYLRGSSQSFEDVAEALHGTDGEDTLEPLFKFLEIVPANKQDKARRFIAGMLSHVAADQIFHPAVYYLTGDYFSEDTRIRSRARAEHRAFETRLDLTAANLDSNAIKPLKSILLKAQASLSDLTPYLSALGGTEKQWKQAIKTHVAADSIFRSKIGGVLLSLPVVPKELRALTTYKKTPLPLENPLKFKNPVSGESHTEKIEELIEKALQRAIELISEVFGAGTRPRGNSLNFDLPGVTRKDARYFAE